MRCLYFNNDGHLKTSSKLLAAGLVVGLGLRIWLAVSDDGIYWPDEIYQSFEPAHRLLFGYGMVPWEFAEGARNWAFPGMVAGLLKALSLLSSEPQFYIRATKCAFGILGTIAALGTYRLARTAGASTQAAAAAGFAYALAGPVIYFAPRAMNENVAAVLLVWGGAWLLDKNQPPAWRLAGAGLLSIAIMFRLHSSVLVAVCGGVLLFRKEWWVCLGFIFVQTLGLLILGGLDALTWGHLADARFGGWFHSVVRYIQFNWIEEKASDWGVLEKTYYLKTIYTAMPAFALLLAASVLLSVKKAFWLGCGVLFFVGLHSTVPHKEFRFLVPVFPWLFAMLFCCVDLRSNRVRWAAFILLVIVAVHSASVHRRLTFGQLGAYPDKPMTSAYDDNGAVNRLLLAAHNLPDLCGLRVDAAHLGWTGGYSYLHRDVPLYHQGQPALETGYFNYAIVHDELSPAVAREGPFALVKTRSGSCVKDHRYSWKLP